MAGIDAIAHSTMNTTIDQNGKRMSVTITFCLEDSSDMRLASSQPSFMKVARVYQVMLMKTRDLGFAGIWVSSPNRQSQQTSSGPRRWETAYILVFSWR